MKTLLVDNNDSFTYNLLHLIKSVCNEDDIVQVCMRDKLSIPEIAGFDHIIVSPGPGIPSQSAVLGKIITTYEKQIPILGICLGHQAIAECYGATIYNMAKPAHGIKSVVTVTDHSSLFQAMDDEIVVGRYHSWCVAKTGLPECLKVTAVDDKGDIMALSHRQHNVHGVQFHPESFMTDCGKNIVSNFLNISRR